MHTWFHVQLDQKILDGLYYRCQMEKQTQKLVHIIYSEKSASSTMKFLIRVLHFLFFFWDFFLPTWPYCLFIFGKSSHLHCFLHNKYQKVPTLIKTYTFINFWENLPPTRLLGPLFIRKSKVCMYTLFIIQGLMYF